MVLVHYDQALYACPAQGCRVNLRRYKADDMLQEHLDTHSGDGEALPQAVLTHVPPHTPQPPIPSGVLHPYQLLIGFISASGFRPGPKKQQNSPEYLEVGNSLPSDWLDAEKEEAELKPRRIRGMGAATHPTSQRPVLGAPPRFHDVGPPRAPDRSVGFDSIGFHQTAREAFDTVAAQSSDEESEPEVKLSKPRFKLELD
ncbi:hypothetical protein FRC08_004809 [Ceratobasidium sp. 394]|nr:hypothetical protein FRC08_004809 [Ceratobasidium sp. 394]